MRSFCFPRLATSRFASIFGNDTIHRHDKKLKRSKTPEIDRINRAPRKKSSEGLCEGLLLPLQVPHGLAIAGTISFYKVATKIHCQNARNAISETLYFKTVLGSMPQGFPAFCALGVCALGFR